MSRIVSLTSLRNLHCVKSENTEFLLVRISHIWTEYRPKKTSYLDTFHTVLVLLVTDLKSLLYLLDIISYN